MTRTKSHSNTHGYPIPNETTSPCHTHPTQPSPTLTPHRDAFFHHLWGRVAQYSVWEIGQDKRKWGIRGEGGRTLLTYPGYSRPAHFLSRVVGCGDIVHRPDYTPNHQRSQLGILPRRIVGTSMTNGTRHDLCIPHHWAMRCPAWTLTRTSHNRVVNKIRPNTDIASISSMLHLVWPLAQSLSNMVVPTRSQNSSWHSLWDLGGTQAPQLWQSNKIFGGIFLKVLMTRPIPHQNIHMTTLRLNQQKKHQKGMGLHWRQKRWWIFSEIP